MIVATRNVMSMKCLNTFEMLKSLICVLKGNMDPKKVVLILPVLKHLVNTKEWLWSERMPFVREVARVFPIRVRVCGSGALEQVSSTGNRQISRGLFQSVRFHKYF